MEVLSEEVIVDILSRLPVKTIIHCKSVCKKWRNLVSNSYFVNLHLSRSPTGVIVHHKSNKNMNEYAFEDPGSLKWVEIEDEVDHHHLHHHPLLSLDLNLTPIFQNSGILQTGSVNGLICLCQNSYKRDNTYICNPVTREYMILSRQQYYKEDFVEVVYGFGVSSQTGEYKVVRILGYIPPNGYKSSLVEAEVYTLGTGQWRSLGRLPYWLDEFGFYGPFLNDHCHWIIYDQEDAPEKLFSFDLNKETFQLFPSPEAIQGSGFCRQSLGILKGCLCKLDAYDSLLMIWVMKEYGIKNSWHKEVVIKPGIIPDLYGLRWKPMFLIEGLKDGSILMVSCEDNLSAYYPQSNTIEDTKMFYSISSALSYRPSFLKLSDFISERVQMF